MRFAIVFLHGVLALLGSIALAADPIIPPRSPFPFFEPVQPLRTVQVVVHSGGRNQTPENTARALEFSIADGVEWVQIDVQLTKDGQHILFHDGDLSTQTSATGRVHDHTLADLQHLDAGTKFAPRFAGQRILTFKEGLELAKGRVNLYLNLIEIDPPLLAREVLAAGMARQVVCYGTPAVLKQIHQAATEDLAIITKWRPQFGLTTWIDDLQPAAVEIDPADVTADICREFHTRGIKVEAKVLDKEDRPEVWHRLIAAGIDWLQTDLPEEILARRALGSFSAKRPRVALHRGANRYAPENTLPAFEKANRLGADLVEFDIQTTQDNAYILLHDSTLDRTTTLRGPVRDHTAADIQSASAGSWFGRPFQQTRAPSLEEFLQSVGPHVELYVDAKRIPPDALADALSKHGLIDRSIVYQSAAYLEKLRAIEPRIRRMPPIGAPAQLDAIVERVHPHAVDARWSILSKDFIDRCHAKGVQVFSDAIGAHEKIADYQQAIRDGIDVIQTDHPLRVLRAIELIQKQD
jgi:glycerophosphoryl diester phosphodiesterase